MTKGKAIIYELSSGSMELCYTDYDVEMFGGDSYEANYKLDKENTDKLRAYLEQNHSGTLEEMMISEFGIYMDKKSFAAVCKDNDIEYQMNTWIG